MTGSVQEKIDAAYPAGPEGEAQAAITSLAAKASRLHSLPDVYFRVRELIRDPDSQLSDLSRVLGSDPGLSARILRIANSAFFGIARKVDTIARAVQVIGYQHVLDLVLSTSVAKAFQGICNKIISMDAFWVASTERALICRALARKVGHDDSERLFVAGLLLDIGHLVIYEHLPEQAQQAISSAKEQHKPLHLVERELLGFDAADLGAELTRCWKLPQHFTDLIAYQHEPRLEADRLCNGHSTKMEIAIAHAANQLAGIAQQSDEVKLAYQRIDSQARALLRLSLAEYDAALAEALNELEETLTLIIPR